MLKLSRNEFKQRRKKLLAQLGSNGMAIIPTAHEVKRNRDTEFRFRPHSDFHYLTGFAEPEAVAVFLPGRKEGEYVLFCRERDPLMETWHGRRAGLEGAERDFDAQQVFAIDQLDEIMPELMANRDSVHYPLGDDSEFDAMVIGWLGEVKQKARQGIGAPKALLSSDDLIHEMRLFKSSEEIKLMRHAANISAQAHTLAMQRCQPGMLEFEVEAEILGHFRRHGCEVAYNSIVGCGHNSCILHYIENNMALNDGDLLLIDAGAEYQYYAADITRTFPVNGTFSKEQAALYQVVLNAQKAAIKAVKPGNPWNKPHDVAVQILTQGLVDLGLLKGEVKQLIKDEAYRRFYMHRTGHWLGMDVHDVGAYKQNGKWRELQPGMVLTVEPGLYIEPGAKGVAKKWHGIGIRIEDDVLVTADGNEVLTAGVIKEIKDIEALMAG
ncbi:MAG: Xaa-Pro aminopeptidase [Gammaproteobacteria bacterium]|nr:Xaa-Pro aminopeptidase [Gammaproteobacteria bacterium]